MIVRFVHFFSDIEVKNTFIMASNAVNNILNPKIKQDIAKIVYFFGKAVEHLQINRFTESQRLTLEIQLWDYEIDRYSPNTVEEIFFADAIVKITSLNKNILQKYICELPVSLQDALLQLQNFLSGISQIYDKYKHETGPPPNTPMAITQPNRRRGGVGCSRNQWSHTSASSYTPMTSESDTQLSQSMPSYDSEGLLECFASRPQETSEVTPASTISKYVSHFGLGSVNSPLVAAATATKQTEVFGKNILINDLPNHFRKEDVESIFKSFGPIASIEIFKDKSSNPENTYGVVRFVNSSSALLAYKILKTVQVFDKPNIQLKKPRDASE